MGHLLGALVFSAPIEQAADAEDADTEVSVPESLGVEKVRPGVDFHASYRHRHLEDVDEEDMTPSCDEQEKAGYHDPHGTNFGYRQLRGQGRTS